MEGQERPKLTPLLLLKAIGLSLCMTLGFGAAFYAGYNSMPYVLAPCILLEVSCSMCAVLFSRYLRGRLFEGSIRNNLKPSLWLGGVLLFISVVGCFVIAVTVFTKIQGFEFKGYGFYAALVPCLLAVFWSGVLIYDARYYWGVWQRALVNSSMPGVKIIFHP